MQFVFHLPPRLNINYIYNINITVHIRALMFPQHRK